MSLSDPEVTLFFCVVLPLLLICLIVSGSGTEKNPDDKDR